VSPLPGRERVWVWVASREFVKIGNNKFVIPSEAEGPSPEDRLPRKHIRGQNTH
jgi:hypothetical protein